LIDGARTHRWAWLVALSLYALGAGVDVACHLADNLRNGNHEIEFSEVAVAFSAGLFWPVDIVAAALLRVR
jgi:hypothetical protein